MQFLSQTDSALAQADVLNVRMAHLSTNSDGTSAAGRLSDAAAADSAPSSDGSSDSSLIAKYGPIIIGLLGANLLVVLILAAVGVVLCVKRAGKSLSRGRTQQYSAVKVGEEETRPLDGLEGKRYSD
jgi:hypothetical protein